MERNKRIEAWFNARGLGEVKVYEMRHGYYLRTRAVSLDKALEIRRLLGGDSFYEWINMLFETKRDGKITLEIPIEPLREQFWEMRFPCRKGFGNARDMKKL